ncbi:hypothetical protein DL769_006057 [Monosporascus sp. CRB-8-3]|nr:hypothetical protein DL769_006057 [Monosporascus sp. CRB-8-3]
MAAASAIAIPAQAPEDKAVVAEGSDCGGFDGEGSGEVPIVELPLSVPLQYKWLLTPSRHWETQGEQLKFGFQVSIMTDSRTWARYGKIFEPVDLSPP